jgi:hypothetical protein
MTLARVAAPFLVLLSSAGPCFAFPPYRSTDADTADPHTLELRAGGQLSEKGGSTEFLVPRIRANIGLPRKLEIATEFDFSADSGKFDDGAAGIKWIPYFSEKFSFGVEALALLPVQPGAQGLGTETQFVATYKQSNLRVHLNGGGLYDPRGGTSETGWRTSGLVEMVSGPRRVGFELFAKDTNKKSADIRAGMGVIYNAGPFDVRFGVHAGLTSAAPRVTVNLWFSRDISF